jgi:hypothetical protein
VALSEADGAAEGSTFTEGEEEEDEVREGIVSVVVVLVDDGVHFLSIGCGGDDDENEGGVLLGGKEKESLLGNSLGFAE